MICPMKLLYLLGVLYLLLSVSLLFSDVFLSTQKSPEPVVATAPVISGNSWFAQMRPHCNSVEIDTQIQWTPPPANIDGVAYAAACYGLAGRIEQARRLIEGLQIGQRAYAAGILFNIAHPVADAGDDRSAGPMMRLTIQYQPDNYMALYHAGMSEYALGESQFARIHLKRFLELYSAKDGWRQNAIDALSRLGN